MKAISPERGEVVESAAETQLKRNYGIDLLRIISMIMIVTLHTVRQGGILYSAEQGTAYYTVVWIIEALCIGAVNLYAMISGFVGVNSTKTRFYKLASMWLQVEFYCIISTIIIYCVSKEPFDFARLINRLTPVSTDTYWYFTSYFIMFFFTPFYNKLLSVLNSRQLKYLGVIIFVFSSFWPTVWQTDIMEVNRGYSFLWLSLLYILGGIAKKLELHKKVNPYLMTAIFVLLVLLGAGFKFLSENCGWEINDNNLLISYYSANVLAGTFCLLLAAAKTDIKAKIPIKIIKTLAPLTFGVYIIHTSEYMWGYVLKDAFESYNTIGTFFMLLAVVGTSLGIYLGCSALDALRLALFRLLKVDRFTSNMEIRIRSAVNRFAKKKESVSMTDET